MIDLQWSAVSAHGEPKAHFRRPGLKTVLIPFTVCPLQTHAYYAAKEKPSAVLPKFPDVKNLNLSSEALAKDKLTTFMVMYRAHCQRILDSVVRANFDEVSRELVLPPPPLLFPLGINCNVYGMHRSQSKKHFQD